MRNLLALSAAAVLAFAGIGWYRGWYKVETEPATGGHQNGFPSASIAETPRRGIKTHVGPRAALAFSAISFPNRSFSSGVVRMSVTVGLCW